MFILCYVQEWADKLSFNNQLTHHGHQSCCVRFKLRISLAVFHINEHPTSSWDPFQSLNLRYIESFIAASRTHVPAFSRAWGADRDSARILSPW